MRFNITAYRASDGIVTLTLDANSLSDAQAQAKQQGLDVVSIRQEMAWRLSTRQSAFDLLLFSQELRSLLDAGLSIIESLGALSRKETVPNKKSLIDNLIQQLREGKPFSRAVNEHPTLFPPLYVALISASEQTGDLATALGRFIAYRTQTDSVKKRVTSAAIYPALLVGVGGLVILFLLTYVVPRFSRVFEDFGRDLPWMSQLLMQWGQMVSRHGAALLITLGLVVSGIVFFFRKRAGWQVILRWLNRHPAIGSRFRLYAISRFYRTLGMLQQGGIAIVPALDLARELLGSDLQLSLDAALVDIRAGNSLSAAMERHGLAPPVASDLLKVGEKTGDIGDKMIRIADFYDEDIARWIEWFARLFEPLLMLGIGLFIALIVVLLYMPIFELTGAVQ